MRSLFAIALFAAASATGAQEEGDPFVGNVNLGLLATSGNSETTNANFQLKMTWNLDQWHHEVKVGASGADNEGQTTAERYRARYQAKYDLTETDYLFGLLSYEKDKFSGYDQQTTQAIGYGRRILDSETQTLNIEAGAGFKQNDLRDGTSEDSALFRLAGDFKWDFSESASFEQSLAVEVDSENTYLESISAIKAALVDQLALSLSYTVKSNSEVPAGSEKTDTFTAISLEYDF